MKILCQRNEEHGQRNGHIIEGADEGKQKGLRKERVRIYTKKKSSYIYKAQWLVTPENKLQSYFFCSFSWKFHKKNLRLGKA